MVLPEAAILSNVPCLAMERADKQPGGARLKRQPVIIVRTQQNNSSASLVREILKGPDMRCRA